MKWMNGLILRIYLRGNLRFEESWRFKVGTIIAVRIEWRRMCLIARKDSIEKAENNHSLLSSRS